MNVRGDFLGPIHITSCKIWAHDLRNDFIIQVATSEDWVAFFIYLCPNDTTLASMRQFRTNISVTDGTLTRVINFR